MSWEYLDSGKVNEQQLDLYRSSGDFMIRVNGYELMNSRWHRTEQELSRVAGWCASRFRPRILIGGLGLGYTLNSFANDFAGRAEIVVSERSSEVLRWYQEYFKEGLFQGNGTEKAEFRHCDVLEAIADSKSFDLIVLDVDNGPAAVCGESNARIYSKEGILSMAKSLREDGAILIWSSFSSPDFEKLAREVGFFVYTHASQVGWRDHCHYIFCLFKKSAAGWQQHEFLQAACYDAYASDYQDDAAFTGEWLQGGKRIMEIGVGTGRLALQFAMGRELYLGVDSAAPMLHQLEKKIGGLSIELLQADMLNLDVGRFFDRIFFPFRVLSYCRNESEVVQVLKCARNHLTHGGKMLLNMIDFSQDFVDRWNGQSVSSTFVGPDGKEWKKIDLMTFESFRMKRRIQFASDSEVCFEVDDSLLWVPATRMTDLCKEAGLQINQICPAYEWTEYSGQGEYVIDTHI